MERINTRPVSHDPYRQSYLEDDLKRAVDLVLIHKWGIRKATGHCGVPKSMLERKYVA